MHISGFRGLIILIAASTSGGSGAIAAVNVRTHHNNDSRNGLYVDPAFTKAAAGNLKRDLNFNGSITGHVYAQPLYIEGGPSGKATVIAVTEANNVYALDSASGIVVWQRQVGTPVPRADLPCGDIDPLGITGTPVVDLPSRTLFFDAMTTPDNGATKKHLIYALDVGTGLTRSGWPVDVDAAASYAGRAFTSVTQNQRGALAVIGGILYVPYGGHDGDCGTYHGWLVGVPLSNPSSVMAWATAAVGGGSWGVGGVAGDGASAFIATGNTFGASVWSGGEAILRFQPGPVFSSQAVDYWTPSNWAALDASDTDIGGSGPLLVDVPGAVPSALVVSLGKDGNAYLLNRTNLGGIGGQIAQAHVSSSAIIQAAVTYYTAQGTYVAIRGLSAFRINAAAPPTITSAWSQTENGSGSPFVTSTDGTNNVVVWGIGAEGDERLHGFDGDTGSVVFSGGGNNELMAGVRRFNTGIVARGRVYVAGDNKVYAFSVPPAAIVLAPPSLSPGAGLEISFTNIAASSFSVLGTTNLSLPLIDWSPLGSATETSPGQYQFTDASVTNALRFYRVQSP